MKKKSMKKRSYKKRNIWRSSAENTLIELWAENITAMRNTKKNGIVYLKMAEELRYRGFNVSAEEVKSKIHNLTTKYKKEKAKIEESDWLPFRIIHQIIGSRVIHYHDIEESMDKGLKSPMTLEETEQLPISEDNSSNSSSNYCTDSTNHFSRTSSRSKSAEKIDFQKGILKQFQIFNKQISRHIAISEKVEKDRAAIERKRLKLEETRTELLKEQVEYTYELKTLFENYLKNK